MKKELWIAVFFLLMGGAAAEEQRDNYNEFESLQLSFVLESGITFVPTEPNPKVDFFQADLSFFPKDNGYVKVNALQADGSPRPGVEIKKDISFLWRNPPPTELSYKINADVTTFNRLQPITKKIIFPIRSLEETVLDYTKPTKFIDITPDIEQQARSIISAEDDLYVVVFNLAEWTKKNVEYNLSTLTAEVVQKSSWVLANKKGVCDELTNLFISMLRSVGVPARFVSGMVYSNLDYQWGAHGWAEVYFPDVGWLPFDVTFGQYGWVDPSHIKLKENIDSGSPSAEYTWRATGITVQMKEITVKAELREAMGKKTPPVNIHLQPSHAEVKFKSYVPLLVTVENIENSYVSTSITIKKAPGLTEKNVKEVLLKPRETKTVVWILEIPSGESNYLYTAALEAATSFSNTASSKITYGSEFKFVPREEAEKLLAKATNREEKQRLEGITLNCIPDQRLYYTNDTAHIQCKITNSEQEAQALDVCLHNVCQKVTVEGNQQQAITLETQARTSGRFPIIAENENAVAYTYVELAAIQLPDIYITDVTPDVVDYRDRVVLKFKLNAEIEVHEVTIDFGFDRFALEKFKGSREVTIETQGRNLRNGLKFTVSFLDEKNKPYNMEKAVYMHVTNIPWYANMLDWIAQLLGVK